MLKKWALMTFVITIRLRGGEQILFGVALNCCPIEVQKIWDLVPIETRESESLNAFKFKIKRWVPEGCPCRICKIYLGQVGFIVT